GIEPERHGACREASKVELLRPDLLLRAAHDGERPVREVAVVADRRLEELSTRGHRRFSVTSAERGEHRDVIDPQAQRDADRRVHPLAEIELVAGIVRGQVAHSNALHDFNAGPALVILYGGDPAEAVVENQAAIERQKPDHAFETVM